MPEKKRNRTRAAKPDDTNTPQNATVTGGTPSEDTIPGGAVTDATDAPIDLPEDVVAEEITLATDSETDQIADAGGLETGTQASGLPDDEPATTGSGPESAPAETPAQTGAPVASAATAAFPATEPAAQTGGVTPSGGSGIAGMVIGGVIAAAIGAAATLAFFPEGWRPADTASLERRIAAVETTAGGVASTELDTRIAAAIAEALAPVNARLAAIDPTAAATQALSDRVATLESAPPVDLAGDLAPILARIATLEATELDAQALSAALAPLNTRIAQIEADITAQARAAVEAALADARAQVEAQASELTSREEDIEAAQARIAARAALAELIAAAESGAAVPGALETLRGSLEVPDALAPLAEGLITLGALQDAFAPAARAALTAEAPAADAPIGDRVMSFLRSQTGARSLAPRDGDGADAVLSRAEASLRQGDVATTLSELDTLTGASAAAMADWRAQAEARQAALAALDAMQDQLLGNEG